jgi:hypothetical protein
MFLLNIGKVIPDYTASYTNRKVIFILTLRSPYFFCHIAFIETSWCSDMTNAIIHTQNCKKENQINKQFMAYNAVRWQMNGLPRSLAH